MAVEKDPQHIELRAWLESDVGKARVAKVKQLNEFAEKGMSVVSLLPLAMLTILFQSPVELGVPVSQLALAWLAIKPATSTIILGASKPEQILENLKALEVIPKLTPAVLEKIEAILENKPEARVSAHGFSYRQCN